MEKKILTETLGQLLINDQSHKGAVSPQLWIALFIFSTFIALGTAKTINVLTAVNTPPQPSKGTKSLSTLRSAAVGVLF
jgi:hypothetical protein